MAIDPHEGELNGTTEVILIRPPHPGSSKRTDLFVAIFNEDSADIALQVYMVSGTLTHKIFDGTIVSKGRFRWPSKSGEDYVLDEPSKSIRAVLGGAPTTQPTWYANWREVL